MTRHVFLAPSHPYLKHAEVSVYQVAGVWKVKWRDFLTIIQDSEFATRDEAHKFADQIKGNLHVVDLELLEDCCQNFDEATEFWEF